METPPDHEQMESDLDNITRDLQRQRRALDDRTPLWREGDKPEEPEQQAPQPDDAR